MGPLGVPELIFILVLALLIFGPKRLPEIGRTIGRALGEFRRATTDLKRSIDHELSLEDQPAPPAAAAPRDSGPPPVARGDDAPASTDAKEGDAEPAAVPPDAPEGGSAP